MNDSNKYRKKRVSVMVYGIVSASPYKSNMGLMYFNIIKYLDNINLLNKVYCLDTEGELPVSEDKIIRYSRFFTSRIKFKIISLPFFKNKRRWLTELFFDKFMSRQLKSDSAEILLNITGLNINALQVFKKKGKKVIWLVATFHPQFIKNTILEFEKKYGFKDHSPYLDQHRIDIAQKIVELSDVVIPMCPSDKIIQSYLDEGNDQGKFRKLVHPWNADPLLYTLKRKKTSDKIRFLSVGAPTLKKGTPLLLKAWQEIDTERHQLELIIAGGENETSYQMAPKNVNFVGYVGNIYELYQEVDVLIASSIVDLGTRVILEAMAIGLPVIVSNMHGLADWLPQEVVYDTYDTQQLKQQIMDYVSQPNLLKSRSELSKTTVQTFDYDRYVQSVVGFLFEN